MRWMKFAGVIIVLVALCRASSAAAADETPLGLYWKDGIRIESADKAFQLRIGGRVQADFTGWYGAKNVEDALGENIGSGSEFRRAHLYLGGTLYERLIFMAEYDFADVNSKTTASLPNTNDPFLSGWYVQASSVVTGEHRIYKREEAVFLGVDPEHNFLGGGAGAFELAARFSRLDLNDEGLAGGKLDDVTLGINWYLNPNARVMLDYVHPDLEDVGSADAVVARFQVQL